MYAVGLQRQGFEVLAHVGLLVSYSFLVNGIGAQVSRRQRKHGHDTTHQSTKSKRRPAPGPLKTLETTSIKEVRELIQEGKPVGFVFDNVDLAVNIAEPVLGKHDTLINGTCATLFELYGATEEALDQASAHAAFMSAGPLEQEDIILSPNERLLHHQLMIHTILRMIVCHGGQRFSPYLPILEATQPSTDKLIPLHQSRTYPLPAMEINESSIDGAINVMSGLYAAVGINTADKTFQRRTQFTAGDHKSISNLRKGKECCAGHEGPETSFINLVFIVGFFHLLMTAVTGFLILHFGKPADGIHNAGSLYYHNRLLERKPIAINSPIHYTQARNLISVSLIARVLHCLTLVRSCASIEEYAQHLSKLDIGHDSSVCNTEHEPNFPPSWNRLVEDAAKIYNRYASTGTVEALRRARRLASPGQNAGDMVYENALLFMRDMLNLQEIHSAVKRGDSGRIVLALKTYALSFRGAGRSHYAKEALSIIHHVQKVWPAPLR
ncbi:hypothetical protein FRC07_012688 [Ceratobasidium sp. 392]|nr:hypothetical protein FRC07_012688 [Ceratobasidium sp. 392]